MNADEASARLAAARTSGDQDQLAAALVDHAGVLISSGGLAPALGALDEARAIHEAADRRTAQAICLHMSATVCRMLADFDQAVERARRAEALSDPATPPRVSSIMEQAEVAVLRGQYGEAGDQYARALVEGRAAGLLPDFQARLLRKQGKVLAAADRFDAAAEAIAEAGVLHRSAGTLDEARRADVELAVVCEQAGETEVADVLIARILDEGGASGDHHVLADVELLASGRAAMQGDLAEALACAQRARQHALKATAPLSYVSAVVTIADCADALGDRDTAYAALASGWVTSGDVMGTEAARQLFEPRLEQLREAWGYPEFLRVRDAYNDRRRAAILAGT